MRGGPDVTTARTFLRRPLSAYRASHLKWRYIDNLGPTLAYWRQRPRPGIAGEAARVVRDLNRDGVAVTTVARLFGSDRCFEEIEASVDRLEHELRDEIVAARARADDIDDVSRKTFTYSFLRHMESSLMSPDDVFVRFALNKAVLGVANSYFQMYTRLHRVIVWHTFPSRMPARDSQLWHRDPEDRHVLKVFVYLTDVDDEAGPFVYARGSHPKGPARRREPEFFFESGKTVRRSNDAQMARVVPPDRWATCVGGKGTMIFADTRGYHKGGLARRHERIMYFCTFVSSASPGREMNYGVGDASCLDKDQAFALYQP